MELHPIGTTPTITSKLLLAITSGDIYQSSRLLLLGADPNEETEDGLTPLLLTLRDRNFGMPSGSVCVDIEMVRSLIRKGASVNQAGPGGLTPLMAAVELPYQALETTKLLILYRARPNERDDRGQTALMFAARRGNIAICYNLVKAGADAAMRDYQGRRASDWAQEQLERKLGDFTLARLRATVSWLRLQELNVDMFESSSGV